MSQLTTRGTIGAALFVVGAAVIVAIVIKATLILIVAVLFVVLVAVVAILMVGATITLLLVLALTALGKLLREAGKLLLSKADTDQALHIVDGYA